MTLVLDECSLTWSSFSPLRSGSAVGPPDFTAVLIFVLCRKKKVRRPLSTDRKRRARMSTNTRVLINGMVSFNGSVVKDCWMTNDDKWHRKTYCTLACWDEHKRIRCWGVPDMDSKWFAWLDNAGHQFLVRMENSATNLMHWICLYLSLAVRLRKNNEAMK